MRRCVLSILAAIGMIAGTAAETRPDGTDAGFTPLFDGVGLAGWHVSSATSHSAASAHRSGGDWHVTDGAIVGTQDSPGNGGILVTDRLFGDIEVVLELRNDFGVDSGVFLRATEIGQAYQVMIDYFPGGTIAGLYGEALPGGLDVRNFAFLDTPERIRPLPAAFALPIAPDEWQHLWKSDGWNELRARIVGNPPHIAAWINGIRFLDFADTERRLGDRGAIALQVHGGGDHRGQFVRFRNLRVKSLD